MANFIPLSCSYPGWKCGRLRAVFQTSCNPATPPSSYPIGAQGMPKMGCVIPLATSGSTVGASRWHPNPNPMHLSRPQSAPTFLDLRYLRTWAERDFETLSFLIRIDPSWGIQTSEVVVKQTCSHSLTQSSNGKLTQWLSYHKEQHRSIRSGAFFSCTDPVFVSVIIPGKPSS